MKQICEIRKLQVGEWASISREMEDSFLEGSTQKMEDSLEGSHEDQSIVVVKK